jgi:hypothetical protein
MVLSVRLKWILSRLIIFAMIATICSFLLNRSFEGKPDRLLGQLEIRARVYFRGRIIEAGQTRVRKLTVLFPPSPDFYCRITRSPNFPLPSHSLVKCWSPRSANPSTDPGSWLSTGTVFSKFSCRLLMSVFDLNDRGQEASLWGMQIKRLPRIAPFMLLVGNWGCRCALRRTGGEQANTIASLGSPSGSI